MTPKQIANNLALIALANTDDDGQMVAAVNLLRKTIPHMHVAFFEGLEVASDMSSEDKHAAFAAVIEMAMFDSGEDDTVMDEEIAEDGVEDLDNEAAAELSDAGKLPFNEALLSLRETASAAIRGAGKFIPLEDIEIDDESDAAKPRRNITKGELQINSRRRNIVGKIEAQG